MLISMFTAELSGTQRLSALETWNFRVANMTPNRLVICMLLQHLWQAGLGGSWLQGSCREGLVPRHGSH